MDHIKKSWKKNKKETLLKKKTHYFVTQGMVYFLHIFYY